MHKYLFEKTRIAQRTEYPLETNQLGYVDVACYTVFKAEREAVTFERPNFNNFFQHGFTSVARSNG